MRRGAAQSPENALLDRLVRVGVCTSRDLARARRLVQQLGDDLPMFESVWLDALVRLGRLTPYQVERLESKSDLVIQPAHRAPHDGREQRFVIENHLGGGPLGETLLVRGLDGQRWAAKCLDAGTPPSADQHSRLKDLLSRLSALNGRESDNSVVGPIQLLTAADRLWLIAPHCPGPSTLDLLISRGRFPSAVVTEIARQLIEGLAQLEAAGLAHGDIRPAHIRMLRHGRVVLVDAGVRACLDPDVSIHSRWSVDRYEGLAPELIGTGAAANPRSDHYALGCALYQLLTGRPPFPGGDPLGKLAAHQLKTVPDVRDLAPETEDRLAQELRRWTARDPADRPGSWRETSDRWSGLFASQPARVTRYRDLCERPTPKLPGERRGRLRLIPGQGLAATAALLILGGGIVAALAEFTTAPKLLAIGQEWITTRAFRTEPHASASSPGKQPHAAVSSERDSRGRLALPRPTADGVIELEPGELYRAEALSYVGTVTIRTRRPQGTAASSPTVPHTLWATILADETPLGLTCQELRMESVRLAPLPLLRDSRGDEQAATPEQTRRTTALVHVQAARLDLRDLRFELVDPPSATETGTRPLSTVTQRGPAAIHWHPADLNDARSGEARLENVVWFGHAAGLTITAPIRTVAMTNCLKVGSGPAIALSAAIPRTGTRLLMDHVTLRESGAAIRWGSGDVVPEPESLLLEATDCVFQPHASAGLIEWFGEEITTDRLMAVTIQGSGSIMPENAAVGLSINPQTRRTAPVDPQYVTTDGLAGETPRFIGPATDHPADSALSSAASPRRTDRLQGIDPATLPTVSPQRSPSRPTGR